MLKVDDPRGFVVLEDGAGQPGTEKVCIETAYAEIMVGRRKSAQQPGKIETWYNFKSRRAAEIAFLSVNPDGDLGVWVMRKQYIRDESLMYKLPGGYIIDENPEFHLANKIATDTGLLLEGIPHYLGSMAGHPEIDTPIGLFAAIPGSWFRIGGPRTGIEVIIWSFEHALDFFDCHRLGDDDDLQNTFGNCVDCSGTDPEEPLYHVNSTGFELLHRLDRRLRQGYIVIPGYIHGKHRPREVNDGLG